MSPSDVAPLEPGVRYAPGSVTALAAKARAAGLQFHDVDLDRCRAKSDLLGALAATLSFPDGFGRNWDALADALADLPASGGHGWALRLTHVGAARARLGADFETLLEICEDTAIYWADHGRLFSVLLDEPIPGHVA